MNYIIKIKVDFLKKYCILSVHKSCNLNLDVNTPTV